MNILEWLDPSIYKETIDHFSEGRIIEGVKSYVKSIPITIGIVKAAPTGIATIAKGVATAWPSMAGTAASIGKGLTSGVQAAGKLWLLPAGKAGALGKAGAINSAKAVGTAGLKVAGKAAAVVGLAIAADQISSKLVKDVPRLNNTIAMFTGKLSDKDLTQHHEDMRPTFANIWTGSWMRAHTLNVFRPSLKDSPVKGGEKGALHGIGNKEKSS